MRNIAKRVPTQMCSLHAKCADIDFIIILRETYFRCSAYVVGTQKQATDLFIICGVN